MQGAPAAGVPAHGLRGARPARAAPEPHVAKQRAKADPSIDVSRVPLPSITNEAMDDGMARTLLVSARERLLEFEDAASREANGRGCDARPAQGGSRRARRRGAGRGQRASRETRARERDGGDRLERRGVLLALLLASNTKTSGADGAFGSGPPSVALVVNVFDGAQPSEDLRESAREAQTSLIALKLERDAATALVKETGELASRSADRIDELDGLVRTLTKDLADAREGAESWRRVAGRQDGGGATGGSVSPGRVGPGAQAATTRRRWRATSAWPTPRRNGWNVRWRRRRSSRTRRWRTRDSSWTPCMNK